jgi:hypothetical protein
VTGRRAGQEVVVDVALPEAGSEEAGIERVWARERVDDLLEQQELEPSKAAKIRAEIIGLAIEHQLVTELTAFVAVDSETDTVSGQPRVISVAQPLPRSLNRGAFDPGRQVLSAMAMTMSPMPPPSQSAEGGLMQKDSLPKLMRRMLASEEIIPNEPQQQSRAVQSAPPGGHQIQDRAQGQPLASASRQLADASRRDLLRQLARSQRADGSWNGDGEQTAAALLAFIRTGHTTRAGTFRSAVRKAVEWLKDQPLAGFSAFLRARVLAELAHATHKASDEQAASEARQALPPPGTTLEAAASVAAASDAAGKAPDEIKTLDDARMAVLLNVSLPAGPKVWEGENVELARAWAAALAAV